MPRFHPLAAFPALVLLAGGFTLLAQPPQTPPASVQPIAPGGAAVLTAAPRQAAEARKIDPDLLLHVGVQAGKVRGDTFTDATGSVSGKIIGNPMRATLGPGQGFRFNGSTDWLSIAEEARANTRGLPKRDFTVEAWVNVEQTAEYGSIIGCVQDNGDAETGWTLGYNNEAFTFALASAGVNDPDGKLTYLKAKSALKPGRWYHVAATYDGRSMKLFVNGELEAESKEQSGDIRYPAKAPFTIGCYKDDDEQFPMNGTVLEVKILGRVLTPPQIVEEFTPGVRLSSWEPELEKDQRFVVKPYLQWATTDGMTIMWETSRPCRGYVEYGESLPYTKKTAIAKEPSTMHEVRINGLNIESNYFYRARIVNDDGTDTAAEDLTFQTAVRPDSPYSFVLIGDTQKNKPVIEKLQAFAFSLRPNFQVHLGDVVDKGPDRGEWINELLPASWPLMSRVAMFPAIGNHEENHSNYYQYFSLPSPECYYTYTYGNAQFFVIDTNKPVDPSSEQYAWLESELAKSKATWKFCYHHHPVYCSDEDDFGDTYKGPSTFGDPKYRYLAELFERRGLDIDFSGHVHSYERTWPIAKGKVDQVKGVRYIVSGGGGGGLESAGPCRAWFDQRTYRGHHICYMTIHDKTLQLQVFDLEGRLIDQMDIKK